MPITASINVTPDGFCNHDDVATDDDFMNFEAALIESADRVILGRNSYDLFIAYWPHAAKDTALPEAEQRLARAIVDTPRIVVSRSLRDSAWEGTTVLDDFDSYTAREMASSEDLIVLGSPSIFSQLSQWDCIDRYHFVVEPFVGGRGHRLFGGDRPVDRSALKLEECVPFAGGAVSLTYSRARPRPVLT